MNRPKLKIYKSRFDIIIEYLTIALILGSVLLIAVLYSKLPEMVPIYFNWPTVDENGFGTKDLLRISPVICTGIGLGIYKLTQYPWQLNYPTPINPENAKYNYRHTSQMLRVLNLLVALLCFFVTLFSILDGLGFSNKIEKYLNPVLFILITGIPVLYLIKIILNNKKSKK